MIQSKPVFYDEQQRRWRRTRRMLEAVGTFFTLLLFTFFFNLAQKPSFPEVLFPKTSAVRHAVREKEKTKPKPAVRRVGRLKRVFTLGRPGVPQNYDPLRAAFYVPWDFTSLASLKQHYRDLDLLIPEAIHVTRPDGNLFYEPDPNLKQFLETLQANHVDLPVMPMVNNTDGVNWKVPELAGMLAHEAARKQAIRSLFLYAMGRNPESKMTTTRQAGIVVDFEQIPRSSQPAFKTFIKELGEKLHTVNLKLMVCLPAADWDYDYTAIAAACDAIILMNYDQHWLTSASGPIASQDWFITNLNNTLKLVPPEKMVVGIANYAYDWAELPGRKIKGTSASFQQSLVTASESDAQVEFDQDSLNPRFSYEEDKITHHVWMLDAVTAYNQERAAERLGVRGTALWRLGSEDPSLWPVWDSTKPDDATRAKITEVPPGYDLVLEGDGDIWRITGTPEPGRRNFRYDPESGNIVDEKYVTYPMPYRIDQIGGQDPAHPHKIAITFDDGPDARYTPKILDILKEKHVPAAFFSIGVKAAESPGLLKREYREGHELGNHTWTHPNFSDISKTQIEVELSLTERLLESGLGVKTMLFRPPYGIDHQPESGEEVQFLPIPQKMGYILVGSKIDPNDWGSHGNPPGPPPSAQQIVDRIVEQATNRRLNGHIVLLHDGGGDRSHTVEALPQIIDRLRAAGFEFTSVSAFLGETRAQTMPVLQAGERWLARADSAVFSVYHWLRLSIAWVFLLGIGLVSARALIIGVLAVIEKLLPDQPETAAFKPLTTVVIPAFNEEDVIVETVQSALASDYPKLEVMVVNDGSRDSTGQKLDQNFGTDPRVRIFHQPNQGKPAALNRALAAANGQILVTIDADTAIAPDAISKLVRHFADPQVAGVAGNTKVANRNRWLTRWQALEYITSQNLEKRAFHLLNCITVVPGAIGAWRTSELRQLGGFPHDTVAEDTDLTLAIRRDGKRILYDEHAIARTRAPQTAGDLIRQRFRWTFGTLQAIWKHRDTIGRWRYGTLGWIAVPNIFLFQFLLPLLSPLIDLLFLGSLALWGLAQLHIERIPQLWTTDDVGRACFFFLAFMLIDLLTCVIAFLLEKKEEWSLLLPLLIQRFYYRQMMYVVLFRAIKRAVQGSAVGWGRIEPRAATPAAP